MGCVVSDHILEMDSRHRYWCTNPEHKEADCAGKVFQSVTNILGKAVPKNLAWHGQTRGVIGVKGLLAFRKYEPRKMNPAALLAACKSNGILPESARVVTPVDRNNLANVPKYDLGRMTADEITEALKKERLTVNNHRDDAAEGGTAVHAALEEYITRGVLPSASKVPESKRASIRGLAKFIIDYKPEFLAAEVRTLSTVHGFAGTFDFLANIHAELFEEDGVRKLRPAAGTLFVLGDMKNSKFVYPASHFPQLEAYEGARVEAGEPPTDVRVVLWLNADGHMDVVPSSSSFGDFLALKASADVIGRLDKSWKRPRKAAA